MCSGILSRLSIYPDYLGNIIGVIFQPISPITTGYIPNLTNGGEIWVKTKRTRTQIQVAEIKVTPPGGGMLPQKQVRNSVTWEDLRLELLLLHIESNQLTLLRHLYRMPPERLLLEVFSGDPPGRRPNRRPRTLWSDSFTQLAWDIKIHFAPVATFSDENL